MKQAQTILLALIGVLLLWLAAFPYRDLASATPLPGDVKPASTRSPKDEVVDKFLDGCLTSGAKAPNCDKLRKDAVEILKEDVLRLGSTANRAYLPNILRCSQRRYRVADCCHHAIGMIGLQDSDVTSSRLTNDPVPDVRHAVSNMLTQGKGAAISLLKQRAVPMRNGRAVEKREDAARFSMPVAPDSVYLFDSSDTTKGRLSYVARGKSDPVHFSPGPRVRLMGATRAVPLPIER
jgi:hypothetical protein